MLVIVSLETKRFKITYLISLLKSKIDLGMAHQIRELRVVTFVINSKFLINHQKNRLKQQSCKSTDFLYLQIF